MKRGALALLLVIISGGCAHGFTPALFGAAGFGGQLGFVIDGKDRAVGTVTGAGIAMALATLGWLLVGRERDEPPSPSGPPPDRFGLGDTHVLPSSQPSSSAATR